MKKRILSILLIVCMLLTMLPVSAGAVEEFHAESASTAADDDAVTYAAGGNTATHAGHDNWTALGTEDPTLSGDLGPGNYYLASDVSATGNITISGQVTLCLNGHVLDLNQSYHIVVSGAGADLTICDCQTSTTNGYLDENGVWQYGTGTGTACNLTGGVITGYSDRDGLISGAICVDGGTLTLESGNIAGNFSKGSSSVGSVYVDDGEFTMTGGTIMHNGTEGDGGGVCVSEQGTFHMTGGIISNNTVEMYGGGIAIRGGDVTLSGDAVITQNTNYHMVRSGGGVYLGSGSLTVSGRVQVTGNTWVNETAVPDNVCLGDVGNACSITIGAGGLTSGASIGVNRETFSTASAIVSSGGAGQAQYFFSDNEKYSVVEKNGEELWLAITHIHCICGAKDCSDESHGEAVDFSALYNLSGSLDGGKYYLAPPVTVHSDITISSDVTLCLNGQTLDLAGNNITVENGGSLTICDCKSGGQITGGSGENGGAVYVADGGSFTMYGGTVSGNTSIASGGGVYVAANGSFAMHGGTVTGNTSTVSGGGLYVAGGSFTVSGSVQIAGNQSQSGKTENVTLAAGQMITIGQAGLTEDASIGVSMHSPGVFVSEGGAAYKNCFFADDATYVIQESGGALSLGEPTAAHQHEDGRGFHELPASWNTLSSGSYFLQDNVTAESDVTITGTVTLCLNGKILDLNGHHIVVDGNASLTICDCQTSTTNGYLNENGIWQDGEGEGTVCNLTGGVITGGKVTDYDGGAIYVFTDGELILESGNLAGNTATYEVNSVGGAVYVYHGKFTMTGGTITGNKGSYGGGVYVLSGTFEMTGGTITRNTADGGPGGGVYVENSDFTMTGTEITGNTATGSGGGVYVTGDCTFKMTDSKITGNTANSGGGVSVNGDNNNTELFTMTNSEISGNTATGNGGGVSVGYGIFTMNSGKITGNKALKNGSGGGGGVYVGESGSFLLKDGEITGNTAAYRGGGVYMNTESAFTMNSGTISTNDAASGGGVYVGVSAFTMTGGEITNNTATSYGGGVFVDDYGVITSQHFVAVSGSVQIQNNSLRDDNTPNNVYLNSGTLNNAVITVGAGGLSDDAQIGVTMANRGVFTSGNNGLYTNAFFSDNDQYIVQVAEGSSELELALRPHVHCVCGEPTCDDHGGTVAFTTPLPRYPRGTLSEGNYYLSYPRTMPIKSPETLPLVAPLCSVSMAVN